MQLDHGNIVKLFDANVIPLPYLELEFVEELWSTGGCVDPLKTSRSP